MSLTALDIDALVQSAYAAHGAGNMVVAEAECRRALAADPQHLGAMALLGFLQSSQGRFAESLGIFEKLCRLDPGIPSHWMNLGNAYRGSGAPDDALKAFARAADLGERSVDFYYNLGLTHVARGDFEAARAVFEDALRIAPDDAEVRHQYALACYECMRFELAIKALEDWTPAADTPVETVAAIAQVLLNLGETAKAEQLLASIPASGASPRAKLMHIQILERTNRLREAAELLAQLRASPAATELGSEYQRVAAKIAQRQGQHELALELYRQALVDYDKPHDQHFLLFSIAESLRALGRHDEAIRTLIDAHRSQAAFIRRSRPVAALRGLPQMEITRFHADPADVATWDHSGAPSAADSPVFVVAFPRSGTTLLELTLDAHPLLVSMDEQPFVQNALEDIVATGAIYPEKLGQLTQEQLDSIRARYWERARKKAKLEPGQRLVDKNPLNILRLPAMRRVFPNARIILAVRHPLDVILSCYMQHFRAPDFAMLCSDMPTLTVGYRRTFDFWYEHVELLRPHVLEVRYESFVADLEREARRITEFLEIPWNAAMLAPAERAHAKRFVSTPSYSQVVQPVNTRAVGRWQAYRPYLEPALPIVAPLLERWNYGS